MADALKNLDSFLGDYRQIVTAVGVAGLSFVVLRVALTILRAIRDWGFGRMLSANLKSKGAWAVVTGATDGIGKAYAVELAKRGLNIVLVSRSADKLADVALEIESKQRVKTISIPVDFNGGEDIYKKLRAELVALEIGVLVNNVGFSYEYPEYFLDVEDGDEFAMKMIRINMVSAVMMTRIVMPQMVQRKKGVVINLSSASSNFPLPLLTLYAASKIFVDYFSRGLQAEYRDKGIIIQSVVPYYVKTKMSGFRRSSFFVPTAETYARDALNTIGLQDKTYGYWTHALMNLCLSSFPDTFHTWTSKPMMESVRSKVLKKKARKAKGN